VLVDEEHHELADGLDVVEGIQVEPLMFQDALPRLDERVRETDVGHRQESSERSGFDQLIDSRVEVLNTSVGEKSGWIFGLGGVPRRLEKYQERVPGIETLRDSLSENPAREVVDHRMKVALLHDACLMAKLAYGGSGGGVGYEVSQAQPVQTRKTEEISYSQLGGVQRSAAPPGGFDDLVLRGGDREMES